MTTLPRYPVYVVSKGRWENPLTARNLEREEVPFRIAVEPQEAERYAATIPEERLLVLPFSDLGQGSIPARNHVWEHALAAGAERHWCLDDNLKETQSFMKRIRVGNVVERVYCPAGTALRAVEDFADAYHDVAIAGPTYEHNAPDVVRMPPFRVNVHVYSCLLIDCALPFRWRGRYNEDADLCLQAISRGHRTVLVNAYCVRKMGTMRMKGGNTDELYAQNGRLKMSRALERMWPGVVQTKRRFGRAQHYVDWKRFRAPLVPKEDAPRPARSDLVVAPRR